MDLNQPGRKLGVYLLAFILMVFFALFLGNFNFCTMMDLGHGLESCLLKFILGAKKINMLSVQC